MSIRTLVNLDCATCCQTTLHKSHVCLTCNTRKPFNVTADTPAYREFVQAANNARRKRPKGKQVFRGMAGL